MYAHKSCFSLTAVGVNVSVLLGDSRLVPVFSLLHHGGVRRFKGGLHPHQPLGVFSHGLDRFICSFSLCASYRPAPVLSVAQLREPSLRCLDPLHLGDIWVALIVPLRRLLVLLHPSLILSSEFRGCSVVDPGYLHTRFAGRFFLTIPGIRVYNSIRRSLRPSGDPVLNGNPSFCVAGGFVLYVYVVSVLINNFVQIELVCSLISVYYSGYINGCVSQSYRSSNHVAVVPPSFPIQIRLDDVAFFDYFLYRCNAQHL